MLRPLFHRMLGGTVHPVASHQVITATLVPKVSRRHFITCKFCQPSKLFLPGEKDPHRLTVCGLTYLRELDGSSDPVKAGFTGL